MASRKTEKTVPAAASDALPRLQRLVAPSASAALSDMHPVWFSESSTTPLTRPEGAPPLVQEESESLAHRRGAAEALRRRVGVAETEVLAAAVVPASVCIPAHTLVCTTSVATRLYVIE